MYIRSKCESSNNIISFDNCTFHSMITINEPVVRVAFLQNNNFVSFNNCTFKRNYAEDNSLVSLEMKSGSDISCKFSFNYHYFVTPSNVHFRENQFISNFGRLLYLKGINKQALYISGAFSIAHNVARTNHKSDLILIQNTVVYIYGPLIISHNIAKEYSIWRFLSCKVNFYGMILFKYNFCSQVITLSMQQPYMKIIEYANITFIKNVCKYRLIQVEFDDSWYNNYCLFQYLTSNNKPTVTLNNYAINIFRTSIAQQGE